MDDFEGTGAGQAAGGSNAELDGWGGLAATLKPPQAEEQAAGLAAVTVDPGTLATLVGEEVASVLKAAQVAAADMRSKAEDVAADAQRRISEMQIALAQMSAEMTDLMTRTAERVPYVPGPDRTRGSAKPVGEGIVIEHRSGNGTHPSNSDPGVGERPGDYQRWLQRMSELSSQEPGR